MNTVLTYPSVQDYTRNVQDYTKRQIKAVNRICNSLQKEEERFGDHYQDTRSYSRQCCCSIVELCIKKEGYPPATFNAYMCNVSLSGINFIFPGKIEETELLVGILIPNRDVSWHNGEIVRKKKFLDEEFWEYGIKFKGKTSSPFLEDDES